MIKLFSTIIILIIVGFNCCITIAQEDEKYSNGIYVYPTKSKISTEESYYDFVVQYNGRDEIFNDSNKRLVLDVDGNILDLKNKNVTSKIKYSIQPSTFSRIPTAVSSHGFFAIQTSELKMIANANNLVIREVGLFRNYNLAVDNSTMQEFLDFVNNNKMDDISNEDPHKVVKNDDPKSGEGRKVVPSIPIPETPKLSLNKLGINVSDIPASAKNLYKVDGGVLVKKVNKFSKAELAGLKSGNVISHVNGRKVSSKAFLELYLQGKKSNKINFTVKTITGETKFILMNLQ